MHTEESVDQNANRLTDALRVRCDHYKRFTRSDISGIVMDNDTISALNRYMDRQPSCSQVLRDFRAFVEHLPKRNFFALSKEEMQRCTPLYRSLGGRTNDFTSCLATWTGHSGTVTSVAFHPQGHQVVSGSEDKTLKLWDVATGDCLATWTGHSDYVSSVAIHPQGHQLVSGSRDNTVTQLRDVTL